MESGGIERFEAVEFAFREYKTKPTSTGLSLWLILTHDYYDGRATEYLAEKAAEVEGLISPDDLQKAFLEKKAELVGRRKEPTIPPEFQGKKASRKPAAKKKEPAQGWFDKRGNFVPPQLAEKIMAADCFLYDRGALHYYDPDPGIYKPTARDFIKSRCRVILGDEYRDSRGEEVFRNIETAFIMDSPKLDQNPDILTFRNTALNWRTGEELPHSPENFSSVALPLIYDPEAKCPAIEKFFAEVLPPDCIDMGFEIFGSCLVPGNPFQKAFMLVAGGENGKSKFLELLKIFLGEWNCTSQGLQDLNENRFRAANLAGKLANLYPDLPADVLRSTAVFKALVGGDRISVEHKHGNPFDMKNGAKLVFSCNEIPRSNDFSHAYYRRWVVCRFPNTFPVGDPRRDPHILDKLTTGSELSGLLNKAIEALRILFEVGHFTEPPSTKTELEKYRGDNENTKTFVEKECELNPIFEVKRSDLFQRYLEWTEEQGIRPLSSKRFNSDLMRLCPSLSRDRVGEHRTHIWRGINLTVEAQRKFYSDGEE